MKGLDMTTTATDGQLAVERLEAMRKGQTIRLPRADWPDVCFVSDGDDELRATPDGPGYLLAWIGPARGKLYATTTDQGTAMRETVLTAAEYADPATRAAAERRALAAPDCSRIEWSDVSDNCALLD
jgi:hypothetical protein